MILPGKFFANVKVLIDYFHKNVYNASRTPWGHCDSKPPHAPL